RYPKAESSAASAALPCRALVHAVDRPYPLRTVFVPSAVKRCRWQQHATGACDASDGSNHGNRLRRTTPADHHVLRHGGVKRSLHTARSGRAGRRIAAFHACCANEIKALGGMVAQYLGDGVLAYFGYPTAHENDAERAILAGLAILKAVGTLKTAADVMVQTRIAIGSGVVVVGDLMREGVTQENAAIGETTNPVARLQAMGEPGIGKSRLAGALREHLRSAPHTLLTYFCSPLHQGSALYPFIGQLNRAAG